MRINLFNKLQGKQEQAEMDETMLRAQPLHNDASDSQEQQYQCFEDYEEFYGADAYRSDWHPMSPIGNLIKSCFMKATETEPQEQVQREPLKPKRFLKAKPLTGAEREKTLMGPSRPPK